MVISVLHSGEDPTTYTNHLTPPPRLADALAAKNVTRVFIPARSPNHNAVVERFQERCFKNAGVQHSTGSASTASASSNAKPTPGSPATTTGAATTATTWPATDPSTYSNYRHDAANHRPPLSPQVPDRKSVDRPFIVGMPKICDRRC